MGLLCLLVASVLSGVPRPTGLFLSAPDPVAIKHKNARGSLIRVFWSQVEPSRDQFDFSPIRRQLDRLKEAGKDWSLGVVAGQHAPAWLNEDGKIPAISFNFRGVTPVRISVQWDERVQDRLKALAVALAKEFKSDKSLKLVYVPQMTANGIEGHFNGCPRDALTGTGYTEDKWVAGVERTARDFAAAFDNKALAVEVHEILNSAKPAQRILNDLYADKSLDKRVGAAIWWLSGRTSYQGDLLKVIADFPGDKYAQVIARSDNTAQFEGGDFKSIFAQARQLGIRYIEPWEYEFKSSTFDEAFGEYQKWADSRFAANK